MTAVTEYYLVSPDGVSMTGPYNDSTEAENVRQDNPDLSDWTIRGGGAMTGHAWQKGRFTGATTCSRCHLVLLDDDDLETECEPDVDAEAFELDEWRFGPQADEDSGGVEAEVTP